MFYKLIENQLHSGPHVQLPHDVLHIDFANQYHYPVDGWYYFKTEQEALAHFNLNNTEDSNDD